MAYRYLENKRLYRNQKIENLCQKQQKQKDLILKWPKRNSQFASRRDQRTSKLRPRGINIISYPLHCCKKKKKKIIEHKIIEIWSEEGVEIPLPENKNPSVEKRTKQILGEAYETYFLAHLIFPRNEGW